MSDSSTTDTTDTAQGQKSSFSGDQNCVEVRRTNDRSEVRDTKNHAGVVQSYTFTQWAAFEADIEAGEFSHLAGPLS
ncbi:DUF397 domain-containing protein [Kineosporia sp. NBRC 101731]|uniref:DUF397 domain-containing protein n=1 Tax=Kineosporia sp. NBRC 101731 TaxID=3032199 RepID=UPI0024A1F83E|nr:DUF397 domain-containing protein [Kineosporia sp. NBRC 101731]GLY30815.1 hypothetical protein Kisp02_41800 [Kineosporia sp. NBRC 101731]